MELEHLFPLNSGREFITFDVGLRNTSQSESEYLSSIVLKGKEVCLCIKYQIVNFENIS